LSTVTTRILASFPGCEAMIRPRGHLDGGYRSSTTRTREPFCREEVSWFHL